MFGDHYRVVYKMWDEQVKKEREKPNKMRTFDETKKGKHWKKKAGKGLNGMTGAGHGRDDQGRGGGGHGGAAEER